MTDLIISIINYKTKNLTGDCIESLNEQKIRIRHEIWLIDNASNDGSVEFFKKKFPQVKIIESDRNLGFAGGHNLSLKKISTKYVLILNSDTKVLDGTIDHMVNFMEQQKEVGISGCRILNFDGTLQPNAGDLPLGAGLINWLFNLESLGIKSPSFHRNDPSYYKKTHEVGWVSGNFMLVRKEVLDKIGLLNEDFFMYFEDVEFCMRARKAGFKVMIDPRVEIEHLSGGSLDEPKLRQWSGELKGLALFYREHFGLLASILLKILIFLALILRMLAFSLTGKIKYAKTYAKVITNI